MTYENEERMERTVQMKEKIMLKQHSCGNRKKNWKQRCAMLLVLFVMTTLFPMQPLAAVKSAGTPQDVDSLISSNHLEHNFVKVTAVQRALEIECETPIEANRFSVNVRGVKPATSSSQWLKYVYPVSQKGYCSFHETISVGNLKDGMYVLLISIPSKIQGKASDVFYKNCNFRVENGKVSILQYTKILQENKNIHKKAASVKKSKFLKKDLSDVQSLVFRDPVTKKVAKVTANKVKYFKKVADSVTKGAKTDYEKVLKIYEYIGENFYYDDVAFATKTRQYVDPYRNLYNLRNKKTSANSKNGKVATVCVGYGAAVAALCRAEGIPARIVNGHHVGMAAEKYNNWTTEKGISQVDHWWAEVYVDGRWITVDPTPSNGNRWNRTKQTWLHTGLTNYIYFDPTDEQLATSHLLLNIRGI